MKFLGIEKVGGGKFLHSYNIRYREKNGREKVYEMVSRDGNITGHNDLLQHGTDAIVAIITDKTDEHILLLHEFRLEQGQQIYGLPGGLLEKGESPVQCLKRELFEETGLSLADVYEVLPSAACAVGISNECAVCIFASAEGEIRPSDNADEEIDARWFTRDEVLKLQQSEKFGSWALAFSWIWAHGRFPGKKEM